MRIGVDEQVFELVPGYRRGLVVASGVENRAGDAILEDRLSAAQESLLARLGAEDWRAHPRLAAWLDVFRGLQVNPNNRPPSLAALVKRVSKGGRLPFVSQLVALMNVTSLERLVPVGGDDLHLVGTEIVLRPADGSEVYRPLGRPDAEERPDPGEIVYVDSESGTVLCRTWCWRNSDVTKISEATTSVALNLDLLSLISDTEAADMTEALARDLVSHCGGQAEWYMLDRARPAVEIDV